MTVRETLASASRELTDSQSPWLDGTILLSHILGVTREKLLASFPDPVESRDLEAFRDLLEKRKQGHPVAYLTGKKEFFGRDFQIREGVLCPRPDTEILVEAALAFLEGKENQKVHDLCTGTGCIGLTMALEMPSLRVSASDISEVAEQVFTANRHSLLTAVSRSPGDVAFTRTSLFEGLSGPFDLILSNPPYLTSSETAERMEEGWKEPELALDGGDDGLDLIRTIIPGAFERLSPAGTLMIEAASPQMEEMKKLMTLAGFSRIEILKDLADRDRVITGIKAE